MQVALETAAGETSLLEETDAGGYFVVHVDSVVDAAPEAGRGGARRSWSRPGRRSGGASSRGSGPSSCAPALDDGAALDELLAESRPREQADRAGAP